MPLDVFGSELVAVDSLEQGRWRDSVECPPGKATYYQFRLPFRAERENAEVPRPIHLVGREDEQQSRSIRAMICDLLRARNRVDDTIAAEANNEDVWDDHR